MRDTAVVELSIQLFGPPCVALDGEDRGRPRGTKTWALLALLARSEAPVPRSRLAELLFSDAADPLGALRWTASELRRLLGSSDIVGGDPMALDLPAGSEVDVDVVLRGDWADALDLAGVGRPFLQDVQPDAGAAFELWLAGERRRMEAATEAVLHEATSALLARGETARAVEVAERLVALNPYEENFQVSLIRCLVAAGDVTGAQARVDLCTKLLREELGVEPTAALTHAARVPERAVQASPASLRAQLEAGQAAIDAGVVDAGLETLRGVASGALSSGADDLAARAGLALGIALVHSARGTDEEAVSILHRTLDLAEAAGNDPVAAAGRRELGYVEFLRGRYDRADAILTEARPFAEGDDVELAWIDLFAGSCWSDQGKYAQGEEALRSSMARAGRSGEERATIFAATHLGRLLLLRGDTAEAHRLLTDASERARSDGWTAFLPYPEIYLAEVLLAEDRVDEAADLLEHAYALGCQIGDVCWQTLSLRGLGRVSDRRGDDELALEQLTDAPTHCRRMPDAYIWAEVYALEALVAVAARRRHPSAATWVDQLDQMATRHNLRELAVRAQLHRATLGDIDALDVAQLLAAEVDNPLLATALTADA
jgi:DNA-binding SARP family transcriptional activator